MRKKNRTQVVVSQPHSSVPGQVCVPKRDRFEPAGEGFGGTNVACEGRTEWAEDGHRFVAGVGVGGWTGEGNGRDMGFVVRCFPVCPTQAPIRLFWITLSHWVHAPAITQLPRGQLCAWTPRKSMNTTLETHCSNCHEARLIPLYKHLGTALCLVERGTFLLVHCSEWLSSSTPSGVVFVACCPRSSH